MGIISAIKPPPPPPAGYQRKIAGTAEVERSINGPLDETVITLQDRGYHGPIIIDPRVNTYRVTRSRSDGDWVSIWCANRSAPNEIHVGNNNFNSDEFRYCFNPAGTTTEFYAQGRGIMTVTVTNYRSRSSASAITPRRVIGGVLLF